MDLTRLFLPPGCTSGPEVTLAYIPRISRCHILDAAVMHRCDRNARKDGATALECAPTDKRIATRASTLSINVIPSYSPFHLACNHGPRRRCTNLIRYPGRVSGREPSEPIWYGTEVARSNGGSKTGDPTGSIRPSLLANRSFCSPLCS